MANRRPSALKSSVVVDPTPRNVKVPSPFFNRVSVVAVSAKYPLLPDPDGTAGANRSMRPEGRRKTWLPSGLLVRLSPKLNDQPVPKGPGRVSS